MTINATRDADEYLTADVLAQHGAGAFEEVLSSLARCSDEEFIAVLEIAKILDSRGELRYNADQFVEFELPGKGTIFLTC